MAFFALAAGPAFAADDLAAQKTVYDKNCKKCHGATGNGKNDKGEWMPVAKTLKIENGKGLDLTTAEMKALTDDVILKSMTDGKEKMKKMDKMTPDEMKQMVAYTRHLQGQAK
jgi:mono/diheme cytochrome c family protein